ncbi:hypothetical protein KY317_00960 [Candidatus Woesearchaeota archaeon]|nr:hypothetical protein [Candidatus Woesearchaeota archaeon]
MNIPNKTIELAEETGIHIGDGYMNIYPAINHNVYTYCGHASDDLEYSYYVENLIKKLYDINPSRRTLKNQHTLNLRYFRKELIKFKMKLGLPLGPKNNIKIPEWILNNKEFIKVCVRGIFDTDGSLMFQKKYKKLHYYPHIKFSSKSKSLINQLSEIFNTFKITFSKYDESINERRPNIIWAIDIYGKKNLERFMNIFGSSNKKNVLKYKIWQKYGFCPPKINNKQKENVLKDKINPLIFYVEERWR